MDRDLTAKEGKSYIIPGLEEGADKGDQLSVKEEGSADLTGAHTHNPLKRPLDSKEEEEEDSEEEESESEEEGYHKEDEGDRASNIFSFIDTCFLDDMSSKLKGDTEFVELCRNILKSLTKIDHSDAEELSNMVNRVLEHSSFLEELYNQSEDSDFCTLIRYYGARAQTRVNKAKDSVSLIKYRVSRIKTDKYFPKATKGKTRRKIISGCLSIILGYFISDNDLKKMSDRVAKYSPEIWGPFRYIHPHPDSP